MDFCKSTVRLLSVAYLFSLLVLALSIERATGQQEIAGMPSAISKKVYEQLGMSRSTGPVTAPGEMFDIEGGMDIELGGTNEPTIAVNPLRPDNIAVASLFELRVSTDNGATFSEPTPLQVPPEFAPAGDPSLAFDSQGRLFWTYLGRREDNGNIDVFIAQVDPDTGAILDGYPVNVTEAAGFPAREDENFNDKEWLAADRFHASPFKDRLYVAWTRFFERVDGDSFLRTSVHTTFSTDQGQTWSEALTISAASEGFVWPTHNAVAPNGDAYVAYHSQPDVVGGAPDGLSGQVFVLRSTDGGESYPQKTRAYTPGDADITFNIQIEGNGLRTLDGSITWTQGSAQPWILPDPMNASKVFVVAADDPTSQDHGPGFDEMDIFIVRSTDHGRTWTDKIRVDDAPEDSIQFFPTAAIDDQSRCLVVTWYDTRSGMTNEQGNFLLDVFLRSSCDGGQTFGPEVRINDAPFNPDAGASNRFPDAPLPTLRIGEYNGVAVVTDASDSDSETVAHAVWTGNGPESPETPPPPPPPPPAGSSEAAGQQILFDSVIIKRERDIRIAFAKLEIADAKVTLRQSADNDAFMVGGRFVLGKNSDGIDVLNENVTVTFAEFRTTIPAGSFRRDDGGFRFEGDRGGITDLLIHKDGKFRVTAQGLDLTGIDFDQPVPFSLEIGDDQGETTIPFDNGGSSGNAGQNVVQATQSLAYRP